MFNISFGSGSREQFVGIALDLVGDAFIEQNMQKVLVAHMEICLLYSCCSDSSYNVFDVLYEANRRKMKI